MTYGVQLSRGLGMLFDRIDRDTIQKILTYLENLPIQAGVSDEVWADVKEVLLRLSGIQTMKVMDFNEKLSPLIVSSYDCFHLDKAVENKGSRCAFVEALIDLLKTKIK